MFSQRLQPPDVGVSSRLTGYGWCAYASRRAPCARSMPRIQSTGETLPDPPRGAVTPPATRFARFARLSAAYAGLSRNFVYVAGLVGRSCQYLFGSFQITQWRTHG